MLFLLTGEVQIGKTRWLESLVAELYARGVPCAGVLAPGQWVPSAGERADANGYEKLGIDNVLLPGDEHIPFARRGDLARAEGSFDEGSQAARAELAWHIPDDAIARVNAHFAQLASHVSEQGAPVSSRAPEQLAVEPACRPEQSASASLCHPERNDVAPSCHPERSAEGAEPKDLPQAPSLLVVDELGRLEIWRGGGLTEAVALLAQGPTATFPHALVVVRDYLLDDAEALLAPAWPDLARIAPDDEARAAVLAACGC
ncbi:hypothetical protein VJ923_03385 [Adlercreutzia sp. R25]|uniref:hypothetical protein n=1 Tax=Adlercreutzia shanghongiae TaxID=3111773 RepID=UPI002DBA6733|nr:hypothetical protein [Adlercreutzia sp. R25]MEC4272201.1 hypothetical protein [Adlercreutzia sp. R25]